MPLPSPESHLQAIDSICSHSSDFLALWTRRAPGLGFRVAHPRQDSQTRFGQECVIMEWVHIRIIIFAPVHVALTSGPPGQAPNRRVDNHRIEGGRTEFP